jgi:hypothetical protein
VIMVHGLRYWSSIIRMKLAGADHTRRQLLWAKLGCMDDCMLKPVLIAARLLVGIAAGLVASGIAAQSQQFSADLVRRNADGSVAGATGKLNVSNGKVLAETPDIPTGFFIVRSDVKIAYFVRPAQRIFMEARHSSQLAQVFVSVDPDDPCRQWQAIGKTAGAADKDPEWHCERIGQNTIDARMTTKYRVVSPQNRQHLVWVDPLLKFPVRLEAEDGTTADVVNIQEAAQSESFFEIPAGYRKFDPQQLIDRLKQSDVWAEPIK